MKSLYEDKLQELIILSEKILKIYNKLYNLEINNLKNKDEYKINIKYLNLLIELEDEIYSNLSDKDISLYIDIIKQADFNIKLSDFSLIINDIHNSYNLKRILNSLRFEYNKRLIIYLQKENNEEMANSLLLNQFISEDIINSYLFLIENSFSKIKNMEYKTSLKMIKYIFSYLNKYIENKYKNNFIISSKIYLFSKQIANQYEINNKNYKKMLNDFYIEYINKELNKIGILDNDDNYMYFEYKKILQINLIKAYIVLDKENILLKRKIYDKIKENIEEILSYQNDNIISLDLERLNLYESSKRF